ncbi:uncharacterized protein LAESUDRAFT_294953 [Laetiporus sulphureus 93-53]|uniref:Uncharacterized protein n=1 Tax=Laetiporus sulphureus 93-53 TaxID=1314785 RepID=A0A165DAX1_9APHY|nr:uncharacterized protein LAESUDRAFT_294953 [Laetiporus sulphureus 93-53]KZT04458.1 hypothetical protein LAESUDRAFT_294953 [Laetiporus sulphureus 93-53]
MVVDLQGRLAWTTCYKYCTAAKLLLWSLSLTSSPPSSAQGPRALSDPRAQRILHNDPLAPPALNIMSITLGKPAVLFKYARIHYRTA